MEVIIYCERNLKCLKNSRSLSLCLRRKFVMNHGRNYFPPVTRACKVGSAVFSVRGSANLFVFKLELIGMLPTTEQSCFVAGPVKSLTEGGSYRTKAFHHGYKKRFCQVIPHHLRHQLESVPWILRKNEA